MEKQISFGNFIAHLIPGALAFFILAMGLPARFPEWIEKNAFVFGIAFVSLSLALGLFLDSLRYVVIKGLCRISRLRKLHKFKKVPNTEQIDLYNWIIDNSWRHHQFCGNLCLAVCLLLVYPLDHVFPLLVVAAILVLALAAAMIYKTTIDQLNEAFPK